MLASVAILPVLRAASPDDTALSSIDSLPAGATSFPAPLPEAGVSSSATVSPSPHKSRSPSAKPAQSTARSTGQSTAQSTAGATATTAPPAATTEDGWTVTTGDGGLRTYVRSFKVDGGQAVVKMTSDGVVSLVTATPADGYAVQKVQDSPDNMAVYFNQTNHSFIIHAIWWNDKPFAEVSEVGK